MNRSILIVICDFLLLSLLTFSTDINKMAGDNSRPPARVEVATNDVVNAGDNDLANAMKLALEEEQRNREQLQQQLKQVKRRLPPDPSVTNLGLNKEVSENLYQCYQHAGKIKLSGI